MNLRKLYHWFAQLVNRRQSTILTAALIIMFSYGLSMGMGLIRDRLLVTYFYSCCRAEWAAYIAAFRLPEMLFQVLVAGALSAAFIPVFSQLLVEGKEKANRVASITLNGLVLSFFVLAIPMFVWAEQLSGIITHSFDPGQISLMANLMRMIIVAQGFFVFSSFITGVLQSHHRFLVPALAPIIYNLSIITGIVLLHEKYGIYAPAIGVLAGALLHAIIQLPLLWKADFEYRWLWKFRESHVLEIIRLMVPRALSSGVNQLEIMAAVFFATALSSEALVLMTLAQTLMQIPVKLIGVPMSQAALPSLSQSMKKDSHMYSDLIIDNLLQILYFALPLISIVVILGLPVVRLAFGAANLPWNDTNTIRQMLSLFSPAMLAITVNQLLVRGFYAQKNTKTPLLIGLISVGSFVGMSYVSTFVLKLGVYGLAATMSLASVLQAGLLGGFLNREIKIFSRQLVQPMTKLLWVTLLTAVGVLIPYRLLDNYVLHTERVLPLIGLTVTVTAVGLAWYILLCQWLEVEQQSKFMRLLYQLPGTRKTVAKLRTLTAVAAETPGGS